MRALLAQIQAALHGLNRIKNGGVMRQQRVLLLLTCFQHIGTKSTTSYVTDDADTTGKVYAVEPVIRVAR